MQGKTIIGYTLQRHLGTGGMAEVWYAENEIGKKAAVKLLLPKLCADETIVARFRNEALVMVQLDHPNIRQVYHYGTLEGRPAIVMEYLEGDDLKALMKSGRRFTDAELRLWWNQIVDALNYTHDKGIVHRDIKPSNLFLDTKGNIKLLDFGIAKVKESISMTQTGAMMGTLMYMSPEQVEDSKHIDYRTDVYSLAVTFVHLLTGKAPYDSTLSSDYAIRKGIVELPLDLSALPSDWQGFLAPYLAKATEQRPALRHFNAVVAPQSVAINDETEVTEGPSALGRPSPPTNTPHSGPNPLLPNPNDTTPRKPKRALWVGLALGIAAVVALVVVLATTQTTTFGSVGGHDYVDLGLPSGTLWATCNLGADTSGDYGGYYAWGETKTKNDYAWSTYKYAKGVKNKLTKYCNDSDYGNNRFADNLTSLLDDDDPAVACWGNGWKTPTCEQWKELLEYTTNEWTGKGRLFTSRKNGQTLFFPAAGYREGSMLYHDGSDGHYRSGSLGTNGPSLAWGLFFNRKDYDMQSKDRFYGFSVRPVRKK